MNNPSPLEAIFFAALEKGSPQERAAYLDEACMGDPDLRGRVEKMLAAQAQAGSFLEQPARGPVVTVDEQPVSEGPGTVIGPYKLLEPIGEGGFGVVFMAEQTQPVRRKVALKILKPGMDSRQIVARFEAERQALAIMDHPNIAKVFDGGVTPSGRPYFVMELVKGVAITDFCDQNHLTPRQRLELFIPVCQAVQHAHHKGIIHRDLKPSNVLVAVHDTTPVVKVIDFGVAKALGQELTDKTLFTGIAQMIGTPLYMSPEQAGQSGLDIDTRSDIYSLGVLLYELLTGTTPFDKERFKQAAYDEMRRIIREEEPPRPSTRLSESKDSLPSISAQRHTEPAKLTKLMRGELDWIVMKALEKDRNRRYETANGFAMDVQRYLAEEPVLACPPSVGYRLRKFARRNKVGLAVAGLVLAFLVILGGGVGWTLWDRAARHQEEARKLALTEQGMREALARASTLHGELHAVLKKPGGVQELLNQPARWDLFLQSARVELGHAQALRTRAERAVDAELTQAMDTLDRQLAGDEADRRLAADLEKIRLDQATWVEGGFDYKKATDEYPQTFANAGFADLQADSAMLVGQLRASPIKEQLVAALDNWAHIASLLGKGELAEKLLAVARQTAPDPAWGDRLRDMKVWRDKQAIAELARSVPGGLSPQMLVRVGRLLDGNDRLTWLLEARDKHPSDFWLNFELADALRKSRPVEAAGYYRVALALRPGTLAAYINLGIALFDEKKLPEAIAAYHKAIELDPKCALAYNNLGNALREQKKLPEAIARIHKAIELDPKYAQAYINLGNTLRDHQKLPEAIAAYHKAIELDPKFAFAYNNLSGALRDQQKLPEAIAAVHKAIELDPKDSKAYHNLGLTLYDQKKLPEAIAAYRKAIELDPKYAMAYYNLGIALRDQQKLPEAIAAYQKAIELDPKFTIAYNNLGNALRDEQKLPEAIAAYHKAIELAPNAIAYNNLGIALRNQQKLPEAIAAYHKAIELNPKYALAYNNLGNALCDQKKLPEAIVAYRKANELDPKFATAYVSLGIALRSRGNALRSEGKLDDAIADFRAAATLEKKEAASAHPTQIESSLAELLNDRAWQLVTDADAKSRDPKRAIELAEEAVALLPKNGACWKTLGVGHYRAGNWKTATEALEKARQLHPHYRNDSVTLFFLSMAHGQLKDKERSHAFYDQAVQWRLALDSMEADLRRLCAEAASLLGRDVPPTLQEPPTLTPGPTLVKPAAKATLDNGTLDGNKVRVWEFAWSPVPGATQYHLYGIGANATLPFISNPALTSLSYRYEAKGYVADANRLRWRWKVRALVQGVWTDWSEERTFDVAPLIDNKAASPKR